MRQTLPHAAIIPPEVDCHGLTRAFIVGCPRSGTTLLQALLGTHPQVLSLPESRIFVEEHGVRGRLLAARVMRRQLWKLADSLDARATLTELDPPSTSLSPRPYRTAAVKLLDAVACRSNAVCWLEKTPHHVYYLRTIRRHVPDARIVHIVRDGRAVVASLYEVTRRHAAHWRGPWSLERCVCHWNRAVVATAGDVAAGRGILVDYEALVTKLFLEVQAVGRYLGLTFTESMLAVYQDVAPAIVTAGESWKAGLRAPISDPGLAKFETLLTPEQQRYVEAHLRARPTVEHDSELDLARAADADGSVNSARRR